MLDRITTDRAKESAIDVVNAMLGVALALTPWALGFADVTAAAWNAWIVGAAIALVANGALIAFTQWEEWANLILGVWAIVAPWLLVFAGEAYAAYAHVTIGVVVAGLAAMKLWLTRNRPGSSPHPVSRSG